MKLNLIGACALTLTSSPVLIMIQAEQLENLYWEK